MAVNEENITISITATEMWFRLLTEAENCLDVILSKEVYPDKWFVYKIDKIEVYFDERMGPRIED